MKKVLALVISVAMIFSMSAVAFAVEPEEHNLMLTTVAPGAPISDETLDLGLTDEDLDVLAQFLEELAKALGEELAKPLSREDFTTYIYALAEEQDMGFVGDWAFRLDFTDIADLKDECYEAAAWCVMNNLMGGYGDKVFGFKDNVTREQLFTVYYRFLQLFDFGYTDEEAEEIADELDKFADGNEVSSWARTAMIWCIMNDIVAGKPGNKLDPKAYATGEEALIVMERVSDFLNKDRTLDLDDIIGGGVAGGWTFCNEFEDVEIPEEALEAYKEASKTVDLVPMDIVAYLGEQVVAGTNYLLIGMPQIKVLGGGHEQLYVLKIDKDLKGECTLTTSTLIKSDMFAEESSVNFFQSEGIVGGFIIDDAIGAPLSERAQAAFDKAFEGFTGVGYEPILELGHQVVSGTNYAILCKATRVTATPASGLAVVVIYNDLQGNAEILRICNFEI